MRVRTRGGEGQGQGQDKDKDRGVHMNSEAHSGDSDAIMSKVRQADEQGDWDADEG